MPPAESGAGGVLSALHRLRFAALASLVFTLVAIHAAHGHWIGDFWEHSAVVRELITHPGHPRHPLLLVDAPHAFANPYALIVATLCRITGASSVTGLMVASLVNLLMIVVALRLFVRRFAPAQAEAVSFYLLLFMLLLWGREPWDFSGFYHVNVLNHTLAYPSACAFWVSLLLLALNAKRITEGRPRLLLLIVPMSAFVLLVHPPVFLFAATGLAATALDAPERWREMLVAAGALVIAVVIALAWPYFPVWELLTGASAAFNANNAAMYSQPLVRTFPAVIGVPLLVAEVRRTGRWSAGAWVAMLFGLYALGFVTAEYNYGRVIFFIVFLLQFEIARFVAQLESRLDACGAGSRWPLVTGATVIVCMLLSARPLVSAARDILWGARTDAGYAFLRRDVGQYDVMMADLRTGWIAASFGGKLVSGQHPLAFISGSEQQARRADVITFFDAAASQAERGRILRKYRVSYLFAPRRSPADSTVVSEDALRTFGPVAHDDARFLLVRVDSGTVDAVRP
ncbi:MAG: hypothetical protein ACJ79A_04610 [Gemmatimonadaceae bacterium]